MSAYLDPLYIESLSEWGTPKKLNHCGGWILERPIPSSNDHDAMGPYPIFMCEDWDLIEKDLKELGDDLVSVSLVTDPFGNSTQAVLEESFDVVSPFKEHYITDLDVPIDEAVTKHHRYYSRRGFKDVQVEIIENPIDYLDEWVALFTSISGRHHIEGLRAFSRSSFEKQLRIPGMIMFRATQHSQPVGEALCFIHGNVAYGHLMGINETGHELGVTYPIYWTHLTYLKGKVKWINWGGVSGISNDESSGLAKFKKGWSTEKRTAFFCGKILNNMKYQSLVSSSRATNSTYFPLYRAGEMG
jgi:hypothetical protein